MDTAYPSTKRQRLSHKRRYKRPLDLGILLVSHLLLAPVLVLVWTLVPLLIRAEDRGPVFYRQKRMGKDGSVFVVLKFRTLVPDADQVVMPWEVPPQSTVTRVGRLLRSTALDEVPQVLSILKGDMSFVGPRAMPVQEYEAYVQHLPQLRQRLDALPGLTGLAQVEGKVTRDIYKKLPYDLRYIEEMGLWLDLKLLFLSACYTFTGRWEKRSVE